MGTAAQVDFFAQIDPEQHGRFDGGVGGQDALKASAGARELDAAAPVDKLGQPIGLMEGPASINWATPASTALFAGGQLQWTTQADLHMAAAHTVASVSANATGLFTHDGGIQAVAANGPLSLQAHTDQLEILADDEITIVSANGMVKIEAKQQIILQAGQSSVTLENGNITFSCPGNFTVKGGQHIFETGNRIPAASSPLPDTRIKLFDEEFLVKDKDSLEPLSRQSYRILREDGSYEDGLTDEYGLTHLVSSGQTEQITIELLSSVSTNSAIAPFAAPKSNKSKYKKVSSSTTSSTSIKKRKEVLTKKPQCWIKDHENEISVRTARYSEATTLQGEPLNHSRPVRYKQCIPLKTGGDVIAELRIKLVRALDSIGDLPDSMEKDQERILQREKKRKAQLEHIKETAAKGLSIYLANKFKIQIADPECGERIFAISYRIVWVDSDEHYVLNLHKQELRAFVDGNIINVHANTDEWTFAHEFAHCYGLPDEYGYESDSYVTYIKPDGSKDERIFAQWEVDPMETNSPNATIISADSSSVVKPRHAWHVAIEARDILRKEIKRNITCDIL